MALQLGAFRDALIDARAKPEKADKAAEELAGYENRPANIDARLTLLTWMTGFNLVLTSGVLWRLLSH
ncbi:MAG: integrase [Gammaproteobacteria bacterium]